MKRPETAQETFLYQHQQYKRKIHFLRIFIFVVFLVLWELAADLSWINDFIFSSPKRLVTCFVQMLMEGIIWQHVSITLLETMISFVLVILFTILITVLLWAKKSVSDVSEPYMVVLNSLPKSALAPLLIVWLGGNALHWPENKEFNLYQDVAAARIIFECGAALVQLPCSGVVSEVTTTGPELDAYLKGKNRLCDYLVSTTKTEGRRCSNELAWSRVIWDITTVAWLLDERFMEDYLMPSPIPEYDGHYSVDPKRHLMRYVYHVNRDKVFSDLFTKLANFG